MPSTSKIYADSFAKTVTTSAARIPATDAVFGDAVITALAANTATVYIGPSTVTTANGFPLSAGQSLSIANDGINKLYAISASGSQEIRVLITRETL